MASSSFNARSMVTRGSAMNLDANLSTAEQVAILDEVIQALNDGSHEDLIQHGAELRALQKHKAEDAMHRKKDRLHEAQLVFEADQKQAHAEFERAKQDLLVNMLEELRRKKRGLEQAEEEPEEGPMPKRQRNWMKRFQLTQDEIKADVIAMDQDFTNWPRIQPRVRADDGRLYYKGELLTCLVPVIATKKEQDLTVKGVLSSITNKEVHIRREDDLEVRIWVKQLKGGQWAIRADRMDQPTATPGPAGDGDGTSHGAKATAMDVDQQPEAKAEGNAANNEDAAAHENGTKPQQSVPESVNAPSSAPASREDVVAPLAPQPTAVTAF